MANNIVRLEVQSNEYEQKLKRASQSLLQMAENARKAGATFAIADKQELDFVASLGRLQTTAKTAKGKLGELTAAFTDLAVHQKQLTDEEKKSPYGQALAKSLDQLKGRISEARAQMAEINDELKETNDTGGESSGMLSQLADKFGLNIGQMGKFGAALALATGALKVAKDAFLATETGIDTWEQATMAAERSYQTFLDTLNNGSWSTFFDNLIAAIRGTEELHGKLAAVDDIGLENAAAIAASQSRIQQLRLRKDRGENVDAQLKKEQENLQRLQSEQVIAGKDASFSQMFDLVKRNAAAEKGGAGVLSDAEITYFVKKLLSTGSSAYSGAEDTYRRLRSKGEYQYQYAGMDGEAITATKFDLNRLSRSEQKQYLLASSVFNKRGQLGQLATSYGGFLGQESALWREQNKIESYVNRGSGSGKGTEALTMMPNWEAGQGVSIPLNFEVVNLEGAIRGPLVFIEEKIKELQEKAKNALTSDEYNSIQGEIGKLQADKDKFIGKSLADEGKAVASSWGEAANAIGAVGAVLSQIQDPAARVFGIIAEAIANVAGSFAKSLTKTATPWDWIAAAAAGTATMISTIAAIKSATAGSYATGGIIPGNSFSGDNLTANVNSGELILNRAQQGNIASQLQGSAYGNMRLEAVISGEQIRMVLNNNSRRRGKGEYITTMSR